MSRLDRKKQQCFNLVGIQNILKAVYGGVRRLLSPAGSRERGFGVVSAACFEGVNAKITGTPLRFSSASVTWLADVLENRPPGPARTGTSYILAEGPQLGAFE